MFPSLVKNDCSISDYRFINPIAEDFGKGYVDRMYAGLCFTTFKRKCGAGGGGKGFCWFLYLALALGLLRFGICKVQEKRLDLPIGGDHAGPHNVKPILP